MILLLIAQAAVTLPDIQLHAEVRAKSVVIERKGETTLTVNADPLAEQNVTVVAPRNGATSLRNVTVTVDAKAVIADPAAPPAPAK
jgi:hypothetical protein